MAKRILDPRADWASVVEAIYESTPSDTAWATNVIENLRGLLPNALFVGAYSATYGVDGRFTDVPMFTHPMMHEQVMALKESSLWVRAFHLDVPPVSTVHEILSTRLPAAADTFEQMLKGLGFVDGLGVVVHPRPGFVTVVTAGFGHTVELSRPEREHLARISLHFEAGHRLRLDKAAVIGEIDAKGRVSSARVGAHVARIGAARSQAKRRRLEGAELWTALLEGRLSVVPRGRRYLVLDNPPPTHRMRALSPRETAVLSLAARGSSTKQICYALGISPSLVSMLLQSAAAKVGALSRTDLVRLGALLTRDTKALLDDEPLTSAEEEVLALLERGLGNGQIAAVRLRSVRTIANQVASLLRKTGSTSRRELVARTAAREP